MIFISGKDEHEECKSVCWHREEDGQWDENGMTHGVEHIGNEHDAPEMNVNVA